MLSTFVGISFIVIGLLFILNNQTITAKQIQFQKAIGSPYIGTKSTAFNKLILILSGIGLSIMGFLVLIRWIPAP